MRSDHEWTARLESEVSAARAEAERRMVAESMRLRVGGGAGRCRVDRRRPGTASTGLQPGARAARTEINAERERLAAEREQRQRELDAAREELERIRQEHDNSRQEIEDAQTAGERPSVGT